MIGSPNPGYFTYDGDQSHRRRTATRACRGCRRARRASSARWSAYLKSAGKAAAGHLFDGRSDYDGFTQAGIPAGGLFSGAEENMTAEQAEAVGRHGRRAVRPELPQEHRHPRSASTATALGIHGGGVAYAVGFYAQDISGRNGVPVREDRTRHAVTDS